MMKKMTTLLFSLLALTHTSNIQATNPGYADLITAIEYEAYQAKENLTDTQKNNFKNCAPYYKSDECKVYLSATCAAIKDSPEYSELKSVMAKKIGVDPYYLENCSGIVEFYENKYLYVGLCNLEQDFCSLS